MNAISSAFGPYEDDEQDATSEDLTRKLLNSFDDGDDTLGKPSLAKQPKQPAQIGVEQLQQLQMEHLQMQQQKQQQQEQQARDLLSLLQQGQQTAKKPETLPPVPETVEYSLVQEETKSEVKILSRPKEKQEEVEKPAEEEEDEDIEDEEEDEEELLEEGPVEAPSLAILAQLGRKMMQQQKPFAPFILPEHEQYLYRKGSKRMSAAELQQIRDYHYQQMSTDTPYIDDYYHLNYIVRHMDGTQPNREIQQSLHYFFTHKPTADCVGRGYPRETSGIPSMLGKMSALLPRKPKQLIQLLDFENNQPYEVDYIGNMVIHDAERLRLHEIVSNGWTWVNDVEDVDRLVYYTVQQNNELHSRETEEERSEIIRPILTRYRQQRMTCCNCIVRMIETNRELLLRHLSEREVALMLSRAFICLSRSAHKRCIAEIVLEGFTSFTEFVMEVKSTETVVSQHVELFLDFLIKFTNACAESKTQAPLPDFGPRTVETLTLPVLDFVLRAGSPKTSNGMLFTLMVSMLERSERFTGAPLLDMVGKLPDLVAEDSTISFENGRLWNLFDAIIHKDPSTGRAMFQTIKTLLTAKLIRTVKIDQHCTSVYRELQNMSSHAS